MRITHLFVLIPALIPLSAVPDAAAQSTTTPGRQVAQQVLEELGNPAGPGLQVTQEKDGIQLKFPHTVFPGNALINDLMQRDSSVRSGATDLLYRGPSGRIGIGPDGLTISTKPNGTAKTGSPRSTLHRLAANACVQALNGEQLEQAQRWIDAVVGALPEDGEMRQLQSLVQTGRRQYDAAAESARRALQLQDAWQADRLKQFFVDSALYAEWYVALQRHCQAEPDAGTGWFLLAYHAQMLGRDEDRRQALAEASARLSDDWMSDVVRRRLSGDSQPADLFQ